jgi:hypothetical protein
MPSRVALARSPRLGKPPHRVAEPPVAECHHLHAYRDPAREKRGLIVRPHTQRHVDLDPRQRRRQRLSEHRVVPASDIAAPSRCSAWASSANKRKQIELVIYWSAMGLNPAELERELRATPALG